MFYTGKGDDGTSGTFAAGTRCNKASPVFHALGTVDELNALLGVCYNKAGEETDHKDISIQAILRQVQENLFIVQAELAGAKKQLADDQVTSLEQSMADIEVHIENPHAFVISGECELGAYLDLARSVSRRTEREVLAYHAEQPVTKSTRVYLNRLSSLLYVLARYAATEAHVKEHNPSY